MKRGAYRKREANPDQSEATQLGYDEAVHWARKLKVRWEWLLEGRGLPWPDDTDAGRTRPAAQVAELVDAADPEEQQRILAVVRAMSTKRTGTDG